MAWRSFFCFMAWTNSVTLAKPRSIGVKCPRMAPSTTITIRFLAGPLVPPINILQTARVSRARVRRGFLFLTLFVSLSAHAGLYVEPSVGYTAGSLGQTSVPSIQTHLLILEGRLGYRLDEYRFGVDYMVGFGSGDQLGNSGSYRSTDLGIFVGYELPLNLVAYASIFIQSKAKIEPSENPADFSGQSYRAALAWEGLSFCTISFEGIYRNYSKYDGADLAKPIKGYTIGASVSVPFP